MSRIYFSDSVGRETTLLRVTIVVTRSVSVIDYLNNLPSDSDSYTGRIRWQRWDNVVTCWVPRYRRSQSNHLVVF